MTMLGLSVSMAFHGRMLKRSFFQRVAVSHVWWLHFVRQWSVGSFCNCVFSVSEFGVSLFISNKNS